MRTEKKAVLVKVALVALALCAWACEDDDQGDAGKADDGDTDSGSTGTNEDCDPQCCNEPDFTSCEVITEPDRSYDICVAGRCVSPGCGRLSCNPPGPHFPLPDSGMRVCYDDDHGELEWCPGTAGSPSCAATPFCGQDAQYGWDTQHPASARFQRSEDVPGEPMVRDGVTGLSWVGCLAGLSGGDCGAGEVLLLDWDAALASCDELEWGGHDDWRLPDRYELQSLVVYGEYFPAVGSGMFPALPHPTRAWASSLMSEIPTAWHVKFSDGWISFDVTSKKHHVLCVRGVPTPRPERFVGPDGGTLGADDDVVLDRATGLLWQRCAAGLSGPGCSAGEPSDLTWSGALSFCEALVLSGRDGWRLPNIVELGSLVHHDRKPGGPALDPVVFPGAPGGDLWSATPSLRGFSEVWQLSHSGTVHSGSRMSLTDRVRCVHD